jgi:hemerythrin
MINKDAGHAGGIMWKETYRIGVESIDAQHKELFDTVEKLFRYIESDDAELKKQECINTIVFLKDYAVRHFEDEEAYQRSLNRSDFEEHKAFHRVFVERVLALEQELIESDFSVPSIKEFTGFLTTWLTHHVAGVDQLLKAEHLPDGGKTESTGRFYVDCFVMSANEVLRTITGLFTDSITYIPYPKSEEDIRISIELDGDSKGEAVFAFTKEIAFNLIKSMTMIELTKVDELVKSALSEMANIISGKASAFISASGRNSSISTPVIIAEDAGKAGGAGDAENPMQDAGSSFYLTSELGCMSVSVNVA